METCKWAEKMSGELQKRVTQRETTQIGYFGEESWKNQRVIGEKPEDFITRNTMLSLEKRAGILFLPGQLPKIVFTCFVPVEKQV